MLNRLPDRGEDTARSVGSFQSMQAALGRAAGYNGSWHDDEGARLTIRKDAEGKNDYNSIFAPGEGHVDTGPNILGGAQGTQGIRKANFTFAAREGDMYN
jgi:hypothetical protein